MADMKDEAFKAGRAIDYEDKDIGPQWAKVAKDCGVQKPSAVMLASYDAAALLALGVARPLANAWGQLFAPVAAAKTTALKEKHRATIDTAILLAEHIKGGTLWVTQELLERATRPTSGLSSPCLFLRDGGGVYEAESVQWIEWLRKGVPLGDGMDIDGKFRKPVRIGEEKAPEKFMRDPFGSGPLTMPGLMSVCGASLEGVDGDAVSFLVLVHQHEQLTPAEQRKACALAKGGLDGLLKEYPLAKRKWDGGARPEPMVGREQSRNPPVAGGGDAPIVGRAPLAPPPAGTAPLVVVLGTAAKGWSSIRAALSQLAGAGYIRLWSDNDIRPGEDRRIATQRAYAAAAMFVALLNADTVALLSDTLQALLGSGRPILPVLTGACLVELTPVGHLSVLFRDRPYSGDLDGVMLASAVRDMAASLRVAAPVPARLDINVVAAAIISSGLARSRGALLAGLPPDVVAGLPDANSPSDQVYQDIGALHGMGQILDGSRPLAKYLRSAAMLANQRREAQVFHDALRALGC